MHERPRAAASSGEERGAGGPGGRNEERRALLAQALDGGRFVKLVGVLLAFVLVPLAEIFLFIYIGHLVGNFLVLVLAVLAGAAGALLVADQGQRLLSEEPRAAASRRGDPPRGDRSPPPDPVDLAGLLAAALLLVTPGFVTDLCGYALLVPRVRKAVGKRLLAAAGPRLRAALERAENSTEYRGRPRA